MNSVPTWYELSIVCGLITGAGTIVTGFTAWLWTQFTHMRDDNAQFRDEVAKFREKVVGEYVTTAALLQVEERLVSAINRIGDRFDRITDALLKRIGEP